MNTEIQELEKLIDSLTPAGVLQAINDLKRYGEHLRKDGVKFPTHPKKN